MALMVVNCQWFIGLMLFIVGGLKLLIVAVAVAVVIGYGCCVTGC